VNGLTKPQKRKSDEWSGNTAFELFMGGGLKKTCRFKRKKLDRPEGIRRRPRSEVKQNGQRAPQHANKKKNSGMRKKEKRVGDKAAGQSKGDQTSPQNMDKKCPSSQRHVEEPGERTPDRLFKKQTNRSGTGGGDKGVKQGCSSVRDSLPGERPQPHRVMCEQFNV